MQNNLDFLNTMFDSKANIYKQQRYLKSAFEDSVWEIEFSHTKYEINFDVKLSDGGSLLKSNELLNTVKYWLLANTLPEKGIAYSDNASDYKLNYAICVFDYINLNLGKEIQISKFGLRLLNQNHIKNIIHDLSSNRFKSETVYKISQNLKQYFLEKIKDKSLVDEVGKNNFLESSIDDSSLDMTLEEVYLTRAFLHKNGLYYKRNNNTLTPNLLSIIDYLYKGKCLANTKNIFNFYPGELVLSVDDGWLAREKKSLYQKSKDSQIISESNIPNYRNALLTLNKLNSSDFKGLKLWVPQNETFANIKHIQPEAKLSQRFKTVPSYIIFKSINKAIDFHFLYGNDIVISYENLVKYLTKNKLEQFHEIPKNDIDNIFVGNLSGQVEKWSYFQGSNKFNKLRNNASFYGLIKAYYGATQLVVGAIMARRQSELIALKANESVDYLNKILSFKRSKSTKNVFGAKDTIELPIDEMALDMLKNLENLQEILIKHSHLEKFTNIFSTIKYNNPLKINQRLKEDLYNNNLDVFFDYIEMDSENDARYYIRQHQLRRFFAMSFFWGNGFGGMDTLRWFLGHTDVQHLYHYITEFTEGSVLKSVKVQYAYETLNEQEDLKYLLLTRYGTKNFNLIEREVLEDYIQDLIDEGNISVEPEFFQDNNGQQYKILVKVKGV